MTAWKVKWGELISNWILKLFCFQLYAMKKYIYYVFVFYVYKFWLFFPHQNGQTPLHTAVSCGNLTITKLLLEADADTECKTKVFLFIFIGF